MSAPHAIDLRTSHKTRDASATLERRDLALLALLRIHHREEVQSLTYFQKFIYIAQSGGLDQHDGETDAYAPIRNYFDFEMRRFGPYSESLSIRLDTLVDAGLIDTELRGTNFAGTPVKSYSISSEGEEILSQSETEFSRDELKALKYVKYLYSDLTPSQLVDYTRNQFELSS